MNNQIQAARDNLEGFINKTLLKYYGNKTINIFDEFVKFCQDYYDKPAHSLIEIKQQQNTKLRGDVFELFAQKYLKHCFHRPDFINVWLLSEVPDEILAKLGLKRNDLGIDLIAVDAAGKYYAIQAKYRKKGYKAVHGISWKTLSTFYGLVNRSGPWERYIIITNANYVRHVGKKIKKDLSICYGTLSKIEAGEWTKLANMKGYKLNGGNPKSVSVVNTSEDKVIDKVIDKAEINNETIADSHKKKITIHKKIAEHDIQQIREQRLKILAINKQNLSM